jgi:hypothetical protein
MPGSGEETEAVIIEMLALAGAYRQGQSQRGAVPQVVQNWESRPAMTNHLCLDVYDLPQIPTASARSSAPPLRHPQGVCRCRLVEEIAVRDRLVFEDA